uniref:Uncharacterized protein n=1 Tax=Anopheles farauti TaxID=69004 RepID=A0A182QTM6_9DIPT
MSGAENKKTEMETVSRVNGRYLTSGTVCYNGSKYGWAGIGIDDVVELEHHEVLVLAERLDLELGPRVLGQQLLAAVPFDGRLRLRHQLTLEDQPVAIVLLAQLRLLGETWREIMVGHGCSLPVGATTYQCAPGCLATKTMRLTVSATAAAAASRCTPLQDSAYHPRVVVLKKNAAPLYCVVLFLLLLLLLLIFAEFTRLSNAMRLKLDYFHDTNRVCYYHLYARAYAEMLCSPGMTSVASAGFCLCSNQQQLPTPLT